jgi:4-amino-4-deoxy-L-arabinose transferase-like glycosyltransferase
MTRPRLPPRAALLACAIGVAVLAAAFRLYRLDSVPPGLFGDEAADGLVARAIVHGEHFPLFVEEPTLWGSREPLYHYLMAAVFAVGGATPTTLRLTSALLGIATVGVLFAVAQRLFGLRVALFAGLVLAAGRWPVMISRLGLRAVLVPLCALLVVWAFVWLASRGRRRDAVVLGVALGIGFYTYPAFWVVPVALSVPLGAVLWKARPQPWRWLATLAGATALSALLVAAPLLGYALVRPQHFFGRAMHTAQERDRQAQGHGLRDDLQRVLFMLHFRGDTNPRHNLPGAPVLDPITGIAFLAGAIIALRRLPVDPVRYGGMLAFWLLPLLPSALTDSAPHALRTVGAMPAVALLAGIGLDRLADVGRSAGRLATGAALAAIIALNYHDYFHRWAASPVVAAAFNSDAVRFFRYCAALADTHDVYAVRHTFDAPQFRFLELDRQGSWQWVEDERALLASVATRDRVIVSEVVELNGLVEELYPNVEVLSRFNTTGRVYRLRRDQLRDALDADEQERAAVAVAASQHGPAPEAEP